MVNDDILNKLEQLSYIKIDSDRRENIKSEINEILEFVENLNQLNITDNHELISDTLKLRDDIVINSHIGEKILESAPKSQNGFFIVPKIIE